MTILNNKSRLKETRKDLRNNCTEAERKLWFYLKWSKFFWLKFRRQHSIGRYILDFYSTKYKIAIELDWEIHNWRYEYDKIRTDYLEWCWIKVIRFNNLDIINNLDDSLIKLKNFIL